jgi:hypothetical protein
MDHFQTMKLPLNSIVNVPSQTTNCVNIFLQTAKNIIVPPKINKKIKMTIIFFNKTKMSL